MPWKSIQLNQKRTKLSENSVKNKNSVSVDTGIPRDEPSIADGQIMFF